MDILHPCQTASDGVTIGARGRAGGFTLIELLVTVSILALLLSILLPSLLKVRQSGLKAACGSNLHQLALATNMCLSDTGGRYWRYYRDVPQGRRWWFGFEKNGPGTGTNRSLDKNQGVLAPYMNSTDDHLQCPAFPYDSGNFFPKFANHSASYGYNMLLGPVSVSVPTKTTNDFVDRPSTTVVFADGIHFDSNPGFNEGHYLQYMSNTKMMSGYAHFRHGGQAQMLMVDGHAESQALYDSQHQYIVTDGGPAGNLASPDGSERIYGIIPKSK